jgi:hypothetical protein
VTDELRAVDIVELLGRGGLAIPEHEADSESSLGAALATYSALRDPQGAEQLGRVLARSLESFEPTAVLIWQFPYDVVLGFVAARELEVQAIRSYDLEGLVRFEGKFDDEGRVVLVSDIFRQAEPVRAMHSLAEQHHHQVVAAGSLLALEGPGTEELERLGAPLVSLIDLEAVRGVSSV